MTWTNPLTRTATAVALGLTLAAAPGMVVVAQDTGSVAPAPSYDDATLERFVTAAMEVSAVREEYTAQLQAAESEEDAQALVDDANTAMLAAVEEVDGMDVDTYVAIGEAAQQDEQLAARITEIVEQRRSEG
ncbi:DUF4168 domain-containing protein [Meridianimarinicoccus sp. RP-17]|uniref:DUF4168 domain-containing protein n=1 Tax=Meridianimarinicoccus zhengii TaxID=2056810 RepID=UPI000DAD6483|nr:DUF4168 domain-containing protein [Phycocomes zhengii]